MKVATFRWGGRRCVGLLSADASEITPLAFADESVAAVGALALIEAMSEGKPVPPASGPRLPLAAVQLEAPLPRPPRNVFCVGRNYRAHARELATTVFSDIAKKEDGWPIVFTKVPECVIGPGAPIRVPVGITEQVDYEAELAVVIGRGGVNIRAARALEHVWGYTIVNDVSARDVQQRHVQWDLGKSFDTFCPMGPWLVGADELDGRDLQLRCWVNGELRQEARTSEMIFDIPTLIETVSRGITLYPGDVIATGTPAGVGMGFSPPRWLRAGDRVRIEIEGIGVLENPVQ
ncbi:MAG TPA: fumarylacetoacetate hydrolase family protein [Burkholderiaceae bacterium]|jgi:2-keto-4-pentenoate hydratase/2-oxohepta-3-ene-1,7-dioic acid hydratase in catechol pathway|nr:fumarylacetoacetate hydrolase family protein [Burkholderiaceae bacterium]